MNLVFEPLCIASGPEDEPPRFLGRIRRGIAWSVTISPDRWWWIGTGVYTSAGWTRRSPSIDGQLVHIHITVYKLCETWELTEVYRERGEIKRKGWRNCCCCCCCCTIDAGTWERKRKKKRANYGRLSTSLRRSPFPGTVFVLVFRRRMTKRRNINRQFEHWLLSLSQLVVVLTYRFTILIRFISFFSTFIYLGEKEW